MIFFTSDTHFCHTAILKYCKRDFPSIDKHDEELIYRWNYVVRKKDIVFHLGDFCLAPKKKWIEIRRQLNGRIYLIKGNHDRSSNSFYQEYFEDVKEYWRRKIQYPGGIIKVVLCHYPIESWDGRYRGTIHLHGHVHARNDPNEYRSIPLRMNVSVDFHSYAPISINDIVSRIRVRGG